MFDCIPNTALHLLNLCHERYHLLKEKEAVLATSPAILPACKRPKIQEENKIQNLNQQQQKPKINVGFLVIEIYFIFILLSCL